MKTEKQLISLSAYILISKNRTSVFKALENNGKMPRDLAKETHILPNYVSALLAELKEKDIVECINPEVHKGKVYILTEKGKQISEFMKKINLNKNSYYKKIKRKKINRIYTILRLRNPNDSLINNFITINITNFYILNQSIIYYFIILLYYYLIILFLKPNL